MRDGGGGGDTACVKQVSCCCWPPLTPLLRKPGRESNQLYGAMNGVTDKVCPFSTLHALLEGNGKRNGVYIWRGYCWLGLGWPAGWFAGWLVLEREREDPAYSNQAPAPSFDLFQFAGLGAWLGALLGFLLLGRERETFCLFLIGSGLLIWTAQ